MKKDEKEYTLREAVKLFYKMNNVIEIECIRNEKDLTEEIKEIDMGKGDKFFLKFESFMCYFQDLDYFKVSIYKDNGKPCGFEFSPSKREFYKFIFEV